MVPRKRVDYNQNVWVRFSSPQASNVPHPQDIFIGLRQRQLFQIDDTDFLKSKKKGYVGYPIAVGGYAFSNPKGVYSIYFI